VRVVVYDKTCVTARGRLTPVWAAGARLYRALRRIDASYGVASWHEAFEWLGAQQEPIDEIQYWGHGKWGRVLVGEESFDASALQQRRAELDAVRERLAPDALIWFRNCQVFGAERGIDFAERVADFFGARVAGHTFIIAFHQSGLRGLAPGCRADWSASEGIAAGTPADPQRAEWSRPWSPRTVTALTAAVPAAWITR
jgi:hypothetical protein